MGIKLRLTQSASVKLLAGIGVLCAVASEAIGQQTSTNASDADVAAVVITGSMIKRVNAETAEAVTVINMDTLKDMGVTSIEQALALVTSNNATITTATNVTYTNFYGGASAASLRGMGAAKTLVLLDGERLANNVSLGSGVDLNTIPFAAIDRIEVLREGASSLYGSDAIAGVINFITRKNLEGGQANISYARPQSAGGASDSVDFSYGVGNLAADGYNFMFAANTTHQGELTASQRSFASTGYNPELGLANFNGPYGPTPGSYSDSNGNLWQIGYPACAGNPHLAAVGGSCQYLYSAALDLIPKTSTESALLAFTKSLSGNSTLSFQYFYSHFDVTAWVGPMEYSFNMTPANNPTYFPSAANSTCVGTCTTAAPNLSAPITAGWTDPNNNRYFGNINSEQRFLMTFAGEYAQWIYSISVDWSQNKGVEQLRGGLPNYAILAPGNLLSNLINPFGAQSVAGQSLINSSYTNGDLEVGTLTLRSLNGHASRALGDTFDAGRQVQFGFGFDLREEKINDNPTPLATTLYSSTYYPPTVVFGSRNSKAIYGELNVPINKELDFTVSDRYDEFSDFGNTNNGKLSFSYQPLNLLKLRGAASTGFRAPTLVEEYSPQTFGAVQGNMVGPGCATGNYNTVFSQLNCISEGLSLSGGNTNLKPETSRNVDLGFVLQPTRNLDFTIDYYRITLKNEIQTLPSATIYANPDTFANLYVLNNAGTLTPSPASNIQCPTPKAPTCGYIITTQQNTGSIKTDGFDLSANYVMNSDYGKFHVGFEGTLVNEYKIQEYPNGPELSLVGQFNQGNQPVIRWQHLLTLDWVYQKFGAGLGNHFIDHYVDYAPNAAGQNIDVGSYSIWNGYLSYKPIPTMKLLVGINNLCNTNPPFSNQELNWQGGYNPVFSNPLGRTFYGKVTVEF